MQHPDNEQQSAVVFRPEFRLSLPEIRAISNASAQIVDEYAEHYPIIRTWYEIFVAEKQQLRSFDPEHHAVLTDAAIDARFSDAVAFLFHCITPELAIEAIKARPVMAIDVAANWLYNNHDELGNYDVRGSLLCAVAIHVNDMLHTKNPDKHAVAFLEHLPVPMDVRQPMVEYVIDYFQRHTPRQRPH